jgi:hypothetical protein
LASLAGQAERLGFLSLLDEGAQGWIEALVSLALVLDHPHAVAMFDVTAVERADGGHELGGLAAAVIVFTGGDHDALRHRIRHLLNAYTNSEETTLAERTVGGRVVFTLDDRRLPPWAKITWGPLNGTYVVAIGEGVYERIARAAETPADTLAADPWVVSSVSRTAGLVDPALLYVRLDGLSRGADPSYARKAARVTQSLGLADVDRGLWVVGRRGRAIEAKAVLARHGRDGLVTIAGDGRLGPDGRGAIPERAGSYAVIHAEPLQILRGAREAYLAARSPHAAAGARAYWRGLEAAAGASIEQDIVAQLGGPIFIHDYPRHALRLPLAWTVVVPVRGDAGALQARIDRMVQVVDEELARGSPIRLGRSERGVWYAHFGLVGPALAVTDEWLVLSFSPNAVDENIRWLKREDESGPIISEGGDKQGDREGAASVPIRDRPPVVRPVGR